jgi:vibriolysin
VPAGRSTLTVTTSGGTGDVDLYVRFNAAPTLSTFNCRPYRDGNLETCTISSPAAGRWYIMLNGYSAYSGVALKAQY